MKRLLTLALALVALAVFTGLSVGQVRRPRFPTGEIKVEKTFPGTQLQLSSMEPTEQQVAEAIASSIVTRKGVEFPSVAKVGSDTPFTGGASCEPGDTQAFTENAKFDLESPPRAKRTDMFPSDPTERKKVVSPPNADWVIQSYVRVITSAGPPYEAGDSAFPAGYSYLTAGNYNSVKTTMHNFVAGLKVSDKIKGDLNAKLDTLISNTSSYSYSLGASHGTVEHTALLRGTGWANLKERHSWYHAHINGILVCSPAYLRDQNALTTRLKTWVNSVVGKLPTAPNNLYDH